MLYLCKLYVQFFSRFPFARNYFMLKCVTLVLFFIYFFIIGVARTLYIFMYTQLSQIMFGLCFICEYSREIIIDRKLCSSVIVFQICFIVNSNKHGELYYYTT